MTILLVFIDHSYLFKIYFLINVCTDLAWLLVDQNRKSHSSRDWAKGYPDSHCHHRHSVLKIVQLVYICKSVCKITSMPKAKIKSERVDKSFLRQCQSVKQPVIVYFMGEISTHSGLKIEKIVQ